MHRHLLPGAARRAGRDHPLSRAGRGVASTSTASGSPPATSTIPPRRSGTGCRPAGCRSSTPPTTSRTRATIPRPPARPIARVHREDARHIEFLAGADLVIHDAQYTLEEYPARRDVGPHAGRAGRGFRGGGPRAARLALFHHEPSRTDDAPSTAARPAAGSACRPGGPEVFAAAEGQYLVVVRPGPSPAALGAGGRLHAARTARRRRRRSSWSTTTPT